MRQPLDEPFVFVPAAQSSTTGRRALNTLGHGAAHVALRLVWFVLWLPMKIMPLLMVVGVLAELGMAYTYFAVRHQPFGGIMSLVMVAAVIFAAGALIRFRTWLIVTRERFRW